MRAIHFRITGVLLALSLLLSLSYCTPYDFSRRYVQQGNLITDLKLSRLKIGMSKDDCAILMGTALLSPMFDSNRWDYVYTWRDGSNQLVTTPLSLYFSHDRLVQIERNQPPKPKLPVSNSKSHKVQ